jgi:hypothetical protein
MNEPIEGLQLVAQLLNSQTKWDQTVVNTICTCIEDHLVTEDNYPVDSSRLLFKLLSIVCEQEGKPHISTKPIEKVYLKLLHCSLDTYEYVKVGEVVAYLLQVSAMHGADSLKGARVTLPIRQPEGEGDSSCGGGTPRVDTEKAWNVSLGSVRALQEFAVLWCNVFQHLQ